MSKQTALHVVLLVGSNREGRFAPNVARWFESVLKRRTDMTLEVVDLAETDLPTALTDRTPASVANLGKVLSRADAFVVITPEYNHSFPAPLKNAIDWYREEWRKKPVAFVSYGGISGGLRAVEQLRSVFAELEAVTMRTTVSFHRAHTEFDTDGVPRDLRRAERTAATMLDEVAWWGTLLRQGRNGDVQLTMVAQSA